MPSLTHYKQVFSSSVILFLVLSSFLAILADFQTHFGFEHLTFSEFILHPMMILRHVFEALLSSLVVPFFVAGIYYAISNRKKLKVIHFIINSASFFLILFHLMILLRHSHLPPTMYG